MTAAKTKTIAKLTADIAAHCAAKGQPFDFEKHYQLSASLVEACDENSLADPDLLAAYRWAQEVLAGYIREETTAKTDADPETYEHLLDAWEAHPEAFIGFAGERFLVPAAKVKLFRRECRGSGTEIKCQRQLANGDWQAWVINYDNAGLSAECAKLHGVEFPELVYATLETKGFKRLGAG